MFEEVSNISEKGGVSGQRSPSPTRSPIRSPARSPSPDVEEEAGVTVHSPQTELHYPGHVSAPREMNDKLILAQAFDKKYRFTHTAKYDIKHVSIYIYIYIYIECEKSRKECDEECHGKNIPWRPKIHKSR